MLYVFVDAHFTRFPSGKCLEEWRKDTFLSLLDATTICLYIQKQLARKNNEFAYYLQYFLGVLSSSTLSSFGYSI